VKNREGKKMTERKKETHIIKQIHIETEEKGREKGITKKGLNRRRNNKMH